MDICDEKSPLPLFEKEGFIPGGCSYPEGVYARRVKDHPLYIKGVAYCAGGFFKLPRVMAVVNTKIGNVFDIFY